MHELPHIMIWQGISSIPVQNIWESTDTYNFQRSQWENNPNSTKWTKDTNAGPEAVKSRLNKQQLSGKCKHPPTINAIAHLTQDESGYGLSRRWSVGVDGLTHYDISG